jgi:hypothetical protein
MEAVLLNGRYTAKDAEHLLTRLFRVKTDFHIAKIDTANASEEDIKHSEKRIRELEEQSRNIIRSLKAGNYKHVAINAKLVFEFCPDYHNV